jgi:hypothetical protein
VIDILVDVGRWVVYVIGLGEQMDDCCALMGTEVCECKLMKK